MKGGWYGAWKKLTGKCGRPGANARYFETLFKQRRFVPMRIQAPAQLDEAGERKMKMNLRLLRIFSVPFALTVCTGYMQAAALTAGTPTIALTCTVGQTCVS